VVVELHAWESRHTNPEGEIIEVLGPPDEEGVDMLSVLRQYNLPLHFPKKVLQEAALLAKPRPQGEPLPEELAGRVDCRAHDVVTIDPDDAKDFDDAICLRPDGVKQWRLWVHIADVSHYVRAGGALDEEASRRGNSTYLVDRVIPMLPEALSNEICSLKPGVDRLTKCVEFVLSNEGRVLEAKFYSAVIRSKQRFTYKEVLAVLQRPGKATRSSACCIRRTSWRSTFAARGSGPARSRWIFRKRKSGSMPTGASCASRKSRTTFPINWWRNTCCWPTRRWPGA
jgi:ribonuclease R